MQLMWLPSYLFVREIGFSSGFHTWSSPDYAPPAVHPSVPSELPGRHVGPSGSLPPSLPPIPTAPPVALQLGHWCLFSYVLLIQTPLLITPGHYSHRRVSCVSHATRLSIN